MLKAVLVAGRRFELAAVSVNPVPAALTLRLLKVATPFCGLTVSVPPKPVPPAREMVIGLAAVVTTFPLESCTSTWTAGEMVAPVCAFDGCWMKASCAAGRPLPLLGLVMVKLALVAGCRPGLAACRVYVPALLTLRPAKDATPFCGVTVSVPLRPDPPERRRVIGLLAPCTAFPLASSTTTWTAGVIVACVSAFIGCCRKASLKGEGGVPLPGALMVK